MEDRRRGGDAPAGEPTVTSSAHPRPGTAAPRQPWVATRGSAVRTPSPQGAGTYGGPSSEVQRGGVSRAVDTGGVAGGHPASHRVGNADLGASLSPQGGGPRDSGVEHQGICHGAPGHGCHADGQGWLRGRVGSGPTARHRRLRLAQQTTPAHSVAGPLSQKDTRALAARLGQNVTTTSVVVCREAWSAAVLAAIQERGHGHHDTRRRKPTPRWSRCP